MMEGLPRQGPGEPSDVEWAIRTLGVPGDARVLDAGCGPGADVETFLALLPEARVTGVEIHAPFVEEARERVPSERATFDVGDMRDAEGRFNLIWCAGALYFLGIEEGLSAFRAMLAPGGAVAFTEPVISDETDLPFWGGYEAGTDAQVLERTRSAGWDVVDSRRISQTAWALYHDPLEARIDALRPGASEALKAVLDEGEKEIFEKRVDGDRNGYLHVLARPQ